MINLVNGLNIFSGLSNEIITQPAGVIPTYIELVDCTNVTVQDVVFQNYNLGIYGSDSAVVLVEGSPGTLLKNIKISNVNPSPPTLANEYKYIFIKSSRGTVVDCCQLIDKHNGSAALAINSTANVPDEVTIRRCLFKNIGPLSASQDGNGYEAIRLSDSARSQESSQSLIENCVFINCGSDGEPECISIKRFDVTVRGCALYGCPSLITVRHGGRGLIENNYIDGQNVVGSGGIRVFGDDNIIRGNYVTNTNGDPRFRQAIVVGNGQVNPALNGYWVANRAILDSNTLVNNTFGISIGEDGGDSSLTVIPTGVQQIPGTSPYANGTLQPATEAAVCTVAIDAVFVGTPTSGTAPLTVAFVDQSTGGATSWLWEFGDGTTSTQQNPSHTYTAAGTYSVKLTATGASGSNTETRANYISVTAPATGCLIKITTAGGLVNPSFTPLGGAFEPNSTVTLTDQSTATHGITHRSWKIAPYGSGAASFVEFSTGTTATYTFPASGQYRVILTAAGPDGCYEAYGDFNITDNALIAAFSGMPQGGFAPHTVNFQDLSVSQGGITSWLWEFGDGTTSTQQNPSHTYTTPGSYNVKLTVSGPGGTDSIRNDSYVNVYGITPSFSSNPTLSGYTHEPFTFTNTTVATPPISSTLWEYSSNGVNWTTFATGLDVATLTFANPGTYQVRLTAGNSQGQASTTNQVIVHERVNASFTATPPVGTAPHTATFRDTSTGSPTAWEWDFGDGATSTAQHPSHTYTAPGTYTVKLKTTGPGGSSTQTQVVYVVQTIEPACTGNLVCITPEGKVIPAPKGTAGQVLMITPNGIIWTNI